jgi:RimJ/RimL family protein N-acetyltransferase
VRDAGLGHRIEELLAAVRLSVRLEPRPFDPAADVGRSRFCGLPDLPTDVPWPTHPAGRHLAFIAQINLADVPREVVGGTLPTDGWLHLFYDYEEQPWGFDPEDRGSWALLDTPAGKKLTPRSLRASVLPGRKSGDAGRCGCCASQVDLIWLDPDHPDPRAAASAVALMEAARQVDRPFMAGTTLTSYLAWLRYGYDGEPPSVALAYDGGGGRPVGLLSLNLPRRDNTHLAELNVYVDPVVRRRGIGRALFSRGVDLAREQGRRVVLSGCVDGTPGVDFLQAMGLERGMEEVLRQLDVASLDWPRLDREAEAAQPHAKAYELVRMPIPTPEEMLDDVAAMASAINDAPTGTLEIEDEVVTGTRIRQYEQAQLAGGRRLYRVVARHRDTGELAGQTVAAVDVERPWFAYQHDTSVVRAHRGHRLGLLLKIEMLRWLREEEPQVRRMDTDNAADNAHMIAINERLGYRVVGRYVEWQRRL